MSAHGNLEIFNRRLSSFSFRSFLTYFKQDMVDGLAMMPDEHVGHVGHDDVAPAVAELLEGKILSTKIWPIFPAGELSAKGS